MLTSFHGPVGVYSKNVGYPLSLLDHPPHRLLFSLGGKKNGLKHVSMDSKHRSEGRRDHSTFARKRNYRARQTRSRKVNHFLLCKQKNAGEKTPFLLDRSPLSTLKHLLTRFIVTTGNNRGLFFPRRRTVVGAPAGFLFIFT